ncbi:conserved hypothetical protein [Treponema primitia ZAS-2]|uniref:YgiT-type zinc finger domain protein n=1 Tax=Treponema primitia (strain ATCC BAA-887 / DSM 12427 / ZAS-2) TaxID=545694 RepID=F5YIZ5_TREPZ|nr:type II toxin-antitoxin system MqsA family antitoxin [Treponema primitia]AEF86022.1 conserved hypothetical protein [Treponema primitia ZAS-2]
MTCGICKAETEQKLVTYTEDVNNSVIVIRNVPATVCTECGNVWYSGTVAAQLEAIVDHCLKGIVARGTLLQVADVAVVNYAEQVA